MLFNQFDPRKQAKLKLYKIDHLPKHDEMYQSTKGMNFKETFKTIYKSEGPKGFFRGLLPSLIKNSLVTGQYFSVLFFFE